MDENQSKNENILRQFVEDVKLKEILGKFKEEMPKQSAIMIVAVCEDPEFENYGHSFFAITGKKGPLLESLLKAMNNEDPSMKDVKDFFRELCIQYLKKSGAIVLNGNNMMDLHDILNAKTVHHEKN